MSRSLNPSGQVHPAAHAERMPLPGAAPVCSRSRPGFPRSMSRRLERFETSPDPPERTRRAQQADTGRSMERQRLALRSEGKSMQRSSVVFYASWLRSVGTFSFPDDRRGWGPVLRWLAFPISCSCARARNRRDSIRNRHLLVAVPVPSGIEVHGHRRTRTWPGVLPLLRATSADVFPPGVGLVRYSSFLRSVLIRTLQNRSHWISSTMNSTSANVSSVPSEIAAVIQ